VADGDREAEPALRDEVRRLREEVARLQRRLAEEERAAFDLRRTLAAQQATPGWKALERARALDARLSRMPGLARASWLVGRTVQALVDEGLVGVVGKAARKIGLVLRARHLSIGSRPLRGDVGDEYREWLTRRRAVAAAPALRTRVERSRATPLVSVLVVLDTCDEPAVRRLVTMLGAQVYERWQLCVVSARRSDGEMLQRVAGSEPRLRIVTDAPAGSGYERALGLAAGDFIAVLDAGDVLAPEALAEMAARLDEEPELDLLYSDEDVVSDSGERADPFFKPDWSPDLLLCTNYVARLGLVRAGLARDVGVRRELGDAQLYDLMLRLTERTTRIGHVAKVLCHRGPRASRVATQDAAATMEMERRAIEEALGRRGFRAQVRAMPTAPGWPRHYAPRLAAPATPLVSIVIPTRDRRRLLEQCLATLLARTAYDRYEVVVVDNGSSDADTLRYLDSLAAPCRVCRRPGAFNFSSLNNFGVEQAKGEQLLFLNDDVEVIEPGWLAAMVEHAERPDVGAVGARLLYPDGRIQHAGIVVGVDRGAANAFRLCPGDAGGKPRLADVLRDCSAVTAACMMVRRRVFEEVGAFDPRLRVVFNDVDLCLRIRQRGYRVLYTPFAVLYHYEGASRGRLYPTRDEKLFRQRWASILARGDPYYNPNLSDTRDDWSLRL
jgi:GT2 family glycosyltransferase